MSRAASSLLWVLAALTTLAGVVAAQGAPTGLAWDVPGRGAHVFDRQSRVDIGPPPSRLRTDLVVAGGDDAEPGAWRLLATTAAAVPADWQKPAFDDGAWASGRG